MKYDLVLLKIHFTKLLQFGYLQHRLLLIANLLLFLII
jgi:hypothetical protein